MARTIDSAKRVINGTWGEAWVDGEKVAECSAAQAKVGKNKTTINLCGQFMEDTKAASGKGTGSLTLHMWTVDLSSESLESRMGSMCGVR